MCTWVPTSLGHSLATASLGQAVAPGSWLPRSSQIVPRAAAPVHVAARSVGSQAPSWELTSHHRAAGSSSSMDQLPGEQWERSRAAMQGLGQHREAGEVRALGTDSRDRAQVLAQAGGAGRPGHCSAGRTQKEQTDHLPLCPGTPGSIAPFPDRPGLAFRGPWGAHWGLSWHLLLLAEPFPL